MTSPSGQAIWAKMTSPGGKQTALACHPTKKVNKAEELTHLSKKIGPRQELKTRPRIFPVSFQGPML